MSHSYFENNRNLQINGDVIFITSTESPQDNHSLFHVSQRVEATNAWSRAFDLGFNLLCDNTAPSARYGSVHSFRGPQCHPGTRIAVQDYIFKWLNDSNGPIAMWMNGPVGIGKSAVAQTVAHLAADRGQLSSAFFFFRSDETRNSAKHLVATLAYEMTQQMPYTCEPVCRAIAADPHIFSSPIEHQINAILLRPLCTPSASSLSVHRLIILDGLDECLDTNTQQTIIRSSILSLLSMSTEIIPHKILIVSRPESHIISAFSASDISRYVKHLTLKSWDTKDDIGIFLRAKLDEIQHTHPLKHRLPDIWPDEDSFRRLRKQSIGNFAYAGAAIRHIEAHTHSPEQALKDLLSIRPSQAAGAFSELDALYRHILLSLNPEIRFILQKVLCLYVYSNLNGIDVLATLLVEEKSVLEMALIRASSLIQINDGTDETPVSLVQIHGPRIEFHHSSFEEFLWDEERSGDLYVFSHNVAASVATALSCLWLYPTNLYSVFTIIGNRFICAEYHGIEYPRLPDMNAHVLNTLVAKKLPTSFFYEALCDFEGPSSGSPIHHVAYFFDSVRWNVQNNPEPTHRYLYRQTFIVLCDWLQSQFHCRFQGSPPVGIIINILLEDRMQTQCPPFMGVFKLITWEQDSLYYLRRVLPNMDHFDLYTEILDRFSVMVLCQQNEHEQPAGETSSSDDLLKKLYYKTCNSIKLTGFSQKLERMVLEGMTALDTAANVWVTPEDCILRFLYGSDCYIDSNNQLVIGGERVTDIRERALKTDYASLAQKTDQYIRQTHLKHVFEYLSRDVEALYRANPSTPRDLDSDDDDDYED